MMKNNKKKKDYKGYKKGRSKVELPHGVTGDNDNDVTWYSKYPNLVNANSSIIFNQRMGDVYKPLPAPASTGTNYSFANNDNSIPGVVVADFRLTFGGSGDVADPINVAAKNLNVYTRHANSGAVNYEQSDQIEYVISVLGLATEIEQLKRDLRLVATFNPVNRYVHRAMLLTMGYTQAMIDDMQANIASYIGQINLLIGKLNTFKIPRDFSIFDHYAWMVSNIFRDDNLDKATYYAYKFADTVHYDWTNQTVKFTPTSKALVSTQLTNLNAEIDNLLNYEDIGIIVGDMLKAWKAEGCRTWSPMALGEVCDASYSEEVLQQMVNTVAVPLEGNITYKEATANTQNILMQQGAYPAGELHGNLDTGLIAGIYAANIKSNFRPELVFNVDQPSNADILIGTRGTLAGDIYVDHNAPQPRIMFQITAHGSYVVTRFRISCYYENNILSTETKGTLFAFNANDSTESLSAFRFIRRGYAVSKFPTIYAIGIETTANSISPTVYAYGKSNLCVDANWLNNLHTGCLMSELSLPMFKLLESN